MSERRWGHQHSWLLYDGERVALVLQAPHAPATISARKLAAVLDYTRASPESFARDTQAEDESAPLERPER